VSVRRPGLPLAIQMRHSAHYVEDIISRSGAAIGRMIAIEEVQPYADQPRKEQGDLSGLAESVRQKGVLEPLLVRKHPESGKYLIISGERRYLAARMAGLAEVPCIEKSADDGETLELALTENMQRKDLTPFEEADGVQALGDRFGLTHEEIARKIGKSRSSVTELLALRIIPDEIKAACIESGVISKSQLLQVARQPTEARMRDAVRRFAQGTLNRDLAREERNPNKKPRNGSFRYVPPTKDFKLTLQFSKGNPKREQVIAVLRRVLQELEKEV
jgi:ParB family transcriptional regulator, chromosome partitioning protein